ncbi:GMC family oxidoreductase N-terminal domain-containing protein [Comamonas piscis]|uniref:GMC family oxidoreductase N-terminal domain-containing protein n=1 Tax=Comamonas piscis TaxID=1562974 RepID=A0A7G5EMV5_9BURK|nr:GMC family oxidoreductase N-terminal domain-containing protein [Comamonas piscis]QMV75330.1 GMC family oxidoreductase N-terminal domain-containing protein [Comamonas piscis]WSO33828.1 GMC family oxidoreductase N-terminal domain-containing protein [Comamonas piscis]
MSGQAADSFDYVVVGSGAAGAIVAARLGEDAALRICVLEAGPPDHRPYLKLPAGFIKVIFNPAVAWQFSSEPTERTGGRRIPLPQGKTLGGSTSINGLVYNRGQREDFDGWAAQGNAGWSYDEVLPYFQRSEHFVDGGDPALRGHNGPLKVSLPHWPHPICEAFLEGAAEQGMARNPDYNGAYQKGVGYFQRSIHNGWRMSTVSCFLRPAVRRGNLDVRTHAQALRILVEGGRACGVEYLQDGVRRQVMARREVVVSAGAINTPKLLQLSGIGDGERLRALGIATQVHLPGVGQHLKDHFSVRLVASVKNATTINELARVPRLWGQAWQWLRGKPNILQLSPSVVHWFAASQPGLERPDLQGVFSPASYREGYVGQLDVFPGMTCGVWQHRPQSMGTVQLASADPLADPVVQPRYLAEEGDRQTLIRGVRQARALLQSQALAPYRVDEVMPGPQVQSDDEILDFIYRYGVSSYHLNGTARMGPRPEAGAVVDAQLRVHGLQGLRVIDASVMPEITSANTCAATMMIGEKGADLLRRAG